MKQKLIKSIIRVGNSAGVLVPKEWLNGKARVELIEKPLNIKKDFLDVLEPYLKEIMGVYVVGSYARGEQTEKSDVDILVVTNRKSDRVKKEKYDILLVTKENIDSAIKNNALPIIPMLREAKALLNSKLLDEYKEISKLSKKNLRWYFSITKSGIELSKASIMVDKERGSRNCSDAVSYSLVLNLRSIYIVDSIRKKQKWSNKGLLSIIKKISGSLEAYEGYLRVKNDERIKDTLPIEEAEKLLQYLSKKLKEQEKWVKAKKEGKNQ